jgi:hypothetical protein
LFPPFLKGVRGIFLEFEFGYCPSTGLRVVSPSTLLRTVSLSNGLSNHLLFGACNFLNHKCNYTQIAIAMFYDNRGT